MKELNIDQMLELKAGEREGDWKDCAGMVISIIGMFGGPVGAVLGLGGIAASAGGCESYLKGSKVM